MPGFSLSRLRATGQYEIAPLRPEPDAASGFDSAGLRRREALGYISYSPDGSRYVDRNAYAEIVIADGDTTVESEPDQLVKLVDLRRRTHTRLAFHGTASSTSKVVWLDDSTIALCGHGEDHSGDRLRILPELRLVQLSRRTVTSYSLP